MHGAPDSTDLFVLQIQSGRMRRTCRYLLYRPISNYGINRLRRGGYRGFVSRYSLYCCANFGNLLKNDIRSAPPISY